MLGQLVGSFHVLFAENPKLSKVPSFTASEGLPGSGLVNVVLFLVFC